MKRKQEKSYTKIRGIDGSHSLKDLGPAFSVEYPARRRSGGNVAYFNFDLATSMGLIPREHPQELTRELEAALLDTFALVIINEHDIEHQRHFPPEEIKPNTYMATRYLQPQHQDKRGLNSGDGRSVWNGEITHRGKTWDISSRGTGATRLSPATTKYGRFFKTGDPSISYGCGCAETDEGFESLFFSEVLHRNGLATERTLAIISFRGNAAIVVRAYPNLIRPSHLFMPLKQGNHRMMTQIIDYYIAREISNGNYPRSPKRRDERLTMFLDQACARFARATAQFEDDYIFCWLDWDGDNILMDCGIIDYGSVRQFGLCHRGYRFDDDGKFSTSLTEQRYKARYIVQSLLQAVAFVQSGTKRPIENFAHHPLLRLFDRRYHQHRRENLLHKLGFNLEQSTALVGSAALTHLLKHVAYFEHAQASRGVHKVADGISHDAIFCLRDILRELPQLYLSGKMHLSAQEFIAIIRSSYAKSKDLLLNRYRRNNINGFQASYWKLVRMAAKTSNKSEQQVLLELTMRSSIINKADRITGDAITVSVARLLRGLSQLKPRDIHRILKRFVDHQDLHPEKNSPLPIHGKDAQWLKQFSKIVHELREGT